jgi:uncharacterized protein (DUF433 family)
MKRQLIREDVGGQTYEYLPLGRFVVSAPGVCRGRPTFKYTRIEVAQVLEWLAAGHSLEKLLAGYKGRVTLEAIQEAARLAGKALTRASAHRAGKQ